MKFPPFAYERPDTLEEAFAALAATAARPLAGGQSLLPLMAFRIARPEKLIDVGALAELRGIELLGAGGSVPATAGAEPTLHIRAATTHAELAESGTVRTAAPFLARLAAHIGHPAVRHRGTIGGSLAHADPAAEWPAACVALGARVELASAAGRRTDNAEDVIEGPYQTTVGEDELIVGVDVPLPAGRRVGIAEVALRPGDFALAGAVCVRDGAATAADDGGTAAVTLFGVHATPRRIPLPAECFGGEAGGVDERALVAALEPHLERVLEDQHADAAFRRHLARAVARRALAGALAEDPGDDLGARS